MGKFSIFFSLIFKHENTTNELNAYKVLYLLVKFCYYMIELLNEDNENVKSFIKKESLFSQTFFYPCSSKTDCIPYKVQLRKNRYLFEVWGAQGGYHGGKGGYSRGILNLKETTNFYIQIGSVGDEITAQNTITSDVYNGGGIGGADGPTRAGGSGGGGTDIRVLIDDYEHRILVAGGGGGGTGLLDSDTIYEGGYGGGYDGHEGYSSTYPDVIAEEGHQDKPGQGTDVYGGNKQENTHSGKFGEGGYGTPEGTQGGGGGGWYGGAGGAPLLN